MDRTRLTPADEIRLAKQIEAGLLAQARLDGVADATPSDTTASDVQAPTTAELETLARQGLAAKETLILANLGLVRVIARELASRMQANRADLFQDGCLALEQALLRYDYRRGRFGSYAGFWIRTTLRQLPRPQADALPPDLLDETPVHRIESNLTRQTLVRVLNRLPPDERHVVRLRHGWEGEPASLAQVATRLDLSIARVRRLESQGLARLRNHWLEAA
jgi:RNA polymerase sigma factor (sigma-70 family)